MSGAGKDTIIKILVKRSRKIVTLPSFTDREKRTGEIDGGNYFFITTEQFKKMIDDGELYEYNIHHNHYY